MTKRLYVTWTNMKQRCYNASRNDYQQYGARGITVCDEWRDNYCDFEEWAMGNGYRDDLTLDRKDTNGPYSPENCKWSTVREQANNRRTNRMLTLGDETMTIAQWAEEIGMGSNTLWRRINNGWSVERALTEPVHHEKRPRRYSS